MLKKISPEQFLDDMTTFGNSVCKLATEFKTEPNLEKNVKSNAETNTNPVASTSSNAPKVETITKTSAKLSVINFPCKLCKDANVDKV